MAIFSQRESVVVVRAAPAADQYGAGATFFEANFWGKLFYAMGILGSGEEAWEFISTESVGALSLCVRHAAEMLQSMGCSGPLVLETSLFSLRGRPWFYRSEDDRFNAPHSDGTIDDEVRVGISTSAEALQDSPDGVTIDVLRPLMFAVNWPDQWTRPRNSRSCFDRASTSTTGPQPKP
jgi:hypothetical protein